MKIVCLDGATLGDADLSEFSRLCEFVKYDSTAASEVVPRLKDADIAMVNKVVLDEAVLKATKLKLILETATGVNNIDTKCAQSLNIAVKNVAGYSTPSVIQHTFALALSLLNNINFFDNFCKDGEWTRSKLFTSFERQSGDLASKKWGIIGLGAIGRGVAQVATAFGAEICYFSTSGANKNADYKSVSLDELLRDSDIISIHAPLNDKTKGLLGAKELKMMKKGAILINVGRGGIVDEAALALAIDEQGLKAGIDVLESEPIQANHPFFSISHKERLLLSPHIAFASKESMQRLMDGVLANLKEWLKTQG